MLTLSDGLSPETTRLCLVRKTACVPQGVAVTAKANGTRGLIVQQGQISICISLTDEEVQAVISALCSENDNAR